MGSTEAELWPTFLGAVQAAASVLLTISYGVLTGHLGILDNHSIQQMSKLCVAIFLPALLITNVGSQLSPDNVTRYALIAVWSLSYTFISLAFAYSVQRLFKLPPWTVVSTTFNNTTSMPLLLTQTLASTGIIDVLLRSDSDTVSDAVKRAQSYFLVNALCQNVLTFTLGPKILSGPAESDEGSHRVDDYGGARPDDNRNQEHEPITERSSLLPNPLVQHSVESGRKAYAIGQRIFWKLPSPLRDALNFLKALLNPPLIGGIIGAVIGLVPALHRAFFNQSQDGGIFNAWLVTSIENIGDLFAALQIVVVGVRLSQCLERMARGEESGKVPLTGAITTLVTRYLIWPLISVAVIYLIQVHTGWLSGDPILPFAMMLMPCGPSAMNLTSLTDVSGSSQDEKLSLAKFLTISYVLSPLLSFAVVASLKATQASLA